MLVDRNFLLNTNSKKIHVAGSKDGRCRIKEMREEYKVFFATYEEACAYPSLENPLAKPCAFCIKSKTT